MHLVLLIVLWIFGGLAGVVVCGGLLLWAAIVFEKPLEAMGIRLNPRCLNCGERSLKKYDLTHRFRGAEKLPYYSCTRCMANFKRLGSGELVGIGIGAANEEERDKLFSRPTNLMGYTKEDLPGDPFGSWFASVQVGLPEETWPEYEGIPMLPLCQIRCDELPNRPACLDGIAMVSVFVASVGEESVSAQGERWVLRTYANLDGLVPLSYPGDTTRIHAYPVSWRAEKDYMPNRYDAPEEQWIDLEKYKRGSYPVANFSRVGGYGWNGADGEPPSNPLQSEFVFQIRVHRTYPWLCGPGGRFSFARSKVANTDCWFMKCVPLALPDPSLGNPFTLGFEVEGLQVYSRDNPHRGAFLRMSYQGRSGVVFELDDLHGLVQITSPEMALRFVRLRTTGFFWPGGIIEHEVCMALDDPTHPEWYFTTRTDGSRTWRTWRTRGLHGYIVLEPKQCFQPGAEPAQVETVENGFRIVRWTCTHQMAIDDDSASCLHQASYQKIAETVKSNGAYTRTVLVQRAARHNDLLLPASGPGETNPDELLRPAA